MPARRPDLTLFHDLPISPFQGWDRYEQILGVLANHDMGKFSQSALTCDGMMRDDRVSAVMETRIGGLMAAPLEIHEASELRKAMKVRDAAEELWEKMIPQAVQEDLMRWALLMGIGIAEIVWDTKPERWTPRLKVWHPQFLYWDWSQMQYRLIAREGIIWLPRTDQEARSDGKWVIWTPYGFQYGWKRALICSLAIMQLFRGWTYRDWARHCEKHGQPLDKAIVPAAAQREEKESFFTAVANRGSDSTIMCSRGEGSKDSSGGLWDVEVIEAQARTWGAFESFLACLDASIAIRVLGQNLTTEVKAGSFAAAAIQNTVRLDKRRADAAIAGIFREQVLTWWAQYNFGDPDLAPHPIYQVDPPEDKLTAATAAKTLGDAVVALELASVPVDGRAMAEEAGIPLLSDEEIAQREAEKAEEAEAKAEAEAERLAKMPPPPPGTAPAAPGSVPAAPEEEEKAPAAASIGIAALGAAPGARKGASYMRLLEHKAQRLAARKMSGDLKAIMSAVNAATDFEDLRARVVKLYEGMDQAALAEVVRKAFLMAHLAGRLTETKHI